MFCFGLRIDNRKATPYIRAMIVSFRHTGLERFFRTGSKAGVQTSHAARLRLIPGVLDQAGSEDDVKALPGLRATAYPAMKRTSPPFG